MTATAGVSGKLARVRSQRWFPVAAAIACFLLVYGSWQFFHWGPGAQKALIGDLMFFPIDLVAVWACWQASRRCHGCLPLRRAWLLIALGLVAWTAGDVTYTVYDIVGVAPYPSLADVFYLCLYPLMLAGILSFPAARRGARERVRLGLDLAMVTLGGSGLVVYFVLGPTAIGQDGGLLQIGFSVAYPVGDLVLLVALGSALLRESGPSERQAERLLAAGLAFFVVADLIYGYLNLHDSYLSGDPVDAIWVIALALFALAAAVQPSIESVEQVEQVPRSQRLAAWSPYAAVAFGFGVLLYAARHVGFYPVVLLILVAIVLAALVAARQLLGQRDLVGAQEELTYQALHDGLTGLPNRALLIDRLAQAFSRSRRHRKEIAVMLLDVDNFKLINESLGHGAGDELLVDLARRLSTVVRSSETIARLGGDEFALVAEGRFAKNELGVLAERILSVFAQPFVVKGVTRDVSGSLGIALGRPEDDSAAADILRDADAAMYRAKSRGKGCFDIFDYGLRKELLRNIELGAALTNALEVGEFEVCYQPIVTTTDGTTLALEALIRWPHPSWGWVQPSEFIPLAEESGMIVRLDEYVLREAVRHLAQLRRRSPTVLPLGVFVNISPRDLAEPGFPALAAAIIAEHGLLPTDVAFELTERVFIDDHDTVLDNLSELTERGIRLLLDDFGTGYSALASLQRFPLAAIKIDRYFIEAIRSPGDEAPIVRAVIGLGHALGLMVIAEGIETQAQLDYLRRLDCDAVQGFLVGRPLPSGAGNESLASQTRSAKTHRRGNHPRRASPRIRGDASTKSG